jgi:DNA-binding GntR family transcriptional regulator
MSDTGDWDTKVSIPAHQAGGGGKEMVFEVDEKLGLGEQAYRKIRDDIVWCRLAPGQELSEAGLSELYGFGKGPIRQALSRLAQDSFILPRARRGHIVIPVTLNDVRDLFDWRLILEPAAAELACGKVDRDRLLELDARCAEGYIPGNIESEARFVEANNAFHMEIAHAAGNSRLLSSLRQVMDEMTRLMHLAHQLRERNVTQRQEHKGLIEALVNGDRETARQHTIAHIENVRVNVIEGIMRFSSLSMSNIIPT